jgi:hypothetical protein
MAKHSISKAAELVGISRSSMYRYWIHKGKIAIETDKNGNKCVDTSELIRVFGDKMKATGDATDHQINNEQFIIRDEMLRAKDETIKRLDEMVKRLEIELEKATARERWLQDQLAAAIQGQKKIEHKPGLLGRIFS